MDKILNFIERHKLGILITLVLHLITFMYLQIATYQKKDLYEPWVFSSRNQESPDDIEITADQIQTEEEQDLATPQEKATSFVKDENDTRERSKSKNVNYTSYSENGTPENIEDAYEQRIKEEIQKKREKKEKQNSSVTSDIENENEKSVKNNNKGQSPSEEAIGGTTMVSFSLKKRHPLYHNDWYIRNPGYTCGDVNGIVKVSIDVDYSGKVITANVLEKESVNATNCMKEQAKKYALMSRFNSDTGAPKKQTGTITYRFIYTK